MKRVIPVVLLLLAATAGCKESVSTRKPSAPPTASGASSPATRAEESHRLIRRYNQLLSEGYKSLNMTPLQEVATKEVAEKAYYHMAAIGEGKSRLVSDLKKIDFVQTDCSDPSKCAVTTKEVWDFAYADIMTGQRSNEVRDYVYDVRYLLENRGGRLLITDISATGEERKELPSWSKMFKKEK